VSGVPPRDRDVGRSTITFAIVGFLLFASFWILRPFLPATVWAVTIVVATWPLLLVLQRALWGSRALAVIVTSLVVIAIFVAPFWVATATITSHAGELFGLAHAASTLQLPPVPFWIPHVPFVGDKLANLWDELRTQGFSQLGPTIAPYAGRVTTWFIGFLGSFGLLVVQFILTVVITGVLHTKGEAAGRLSLRLGHRLAGDRGRAMVILAGHAIRAVAIGVMVTALVESLIGGLGLKLAGVPLSTVLTAVMFVVCLTQLGPGVVLIPSVVWMYIFRDSADATMLLAISIVAITVDNVLRPYLIRRNADLPMLLVLAGVIGGLSAFGLVGLFVGPAILAVSYTVLQVWLAEDIPEPAGLWAKGQGVVRSTPARDAPDPLGPAAPDPHYLSACFV
jgi:predicted PurR-regulated permease PerM